MKKGDHVIPARAGQGTWRKWGDHPQKSLFKIDPRMSLEASATLQVSRGPTGVSKGDRPGSRRGTDRGLEGGPSGVSKV